MACVILSDACGGEVLGKCGEGADVCVAFKERYVTANGEGERFVPLVLGRLWGSVGERGRWMCFN